MRFAVILPWWGYVLTVSAPRRLGVAGLRARAGQADAGQPARRSPRFASLTLLLLIVILLRPVVMVPPAAANNSLLPILVDVSRSMRLTDDGGPDRVSNAPRRSFAICRPAVVRSTESSC